MVPVCIVNLFIIAYHMFVATIAEYPVIVMIVIETDTVSVIISHLEYGLLLIWTTRRVVPHFYHVAVARPCVDLRDVNIGTLFIYTQGIVLVVAKPV